MLGLLVFSRSLFSFVGFHVPQQWVFIVFLRLTISLLLILFYILLDQVSWLAGLFHSFFIFKVQKFLKLRIRPFGIYTVRCIGFCLSRVNYVGVCVTCYVNCFRISGFTWRRMQFAFEAWWIVLSIFTTVAKNSCKCCSYCFCNIFVKNLYVAAKWKVWVLVDRCQHLLAVWVSVLRKVRLMNPILLCSSGCYRL